MVKNTTRRVTKAQRVAFVKLVQRGGESNLTKADALALSTYRHLTVSQREHFTQLARKGTDSERRE